MRQLRALSTCICIFLCLAFAHLAAFAASSRGRLRAPTKNHFRGKALKAQTGDRDEHFLGEELHKPIVESGAELPASLSLTAAALALAAWAAGKLTVAAVLAFLTLALAIVASWTAGFVDATDQVAPDLEKLAAREQEWAELEKLKQELKQDQEVKRNEKSHGKLEGHKRQNKREAAKQAITAAVFGIPRSIHSKLAFNNHHTAEAKLDNNVSSGSHVVAKEASFDSHSSSMVDDSSVPGMADANLIVSVDCDRQCAEAVSKSAGVARLMEEPLGEILAAMAQEDWRVEPVDPDNGIFAMFLPSVKVDFPMGSVSIPSPKFECRVRDDKRTSGHEKQRLVGDLVLQNGDKIMTVKLGFPMAAEFSVSAAGVARARIGQTGDAVFLQADVKMGLHVPRVPGITKVMQVFVKNYANNSTFDCAVALAKGADQVGKKADVAEKTGVAVATAAAAIVAGEVEASMVAGMQGAAGVTDILGSIP